MTNRYKFFTGIKHLIDIGRIKVFKNLPENALLVVTRVADFDPQTNDLWDYSANKSFARDGVVCYLCKEPVVMSNGVFNEYHRKPKPKMVRCTVCIVDPLMEIAAKPDDSPNIRRTAPPKPITIPVDDITDTLVDDVEILDPIKPENE
jgi:hypothetical protein